MSEKEEKKEAGKKLNDFLEKNRNGLLTCFILVVVVLLGFLVFEVLNSTVSKRNLADIDSIFYKMTKGSEALDENELEARRAEFLEELQPYTKKLGVTGVRANIVSAELCYQKGDYSTAITYWDAAANKDKKAYSAPIANYNKGVCYEQVGDLDNAALCYKTAAEFEDFILVNHAKFSYGRVLETQGKYAEAVSVYTELNDASPDDNWAQLAKTRIIALTVDNKIQ